MQTFPPLFDFPPPPVELLILLVVILVIWAVVRVINDARTWFKEEIQGDFRAPAKKSGRRRLKELLVFLVVILVTWAVVSVVKYARTWF
jgi:Na+-transporting methylmalonyl-CoA/oxaloacetate decarboxylase gamma subunit